MFKVTFEGRSAKNKIFTKFHKAVSYAAKYSVTKGNAWGNGEKDEITGDDFTIYVRKSVWFPIFHGSGGSNALGDEVLFEIEKIKG